jgi:hypothetical protein
MKTPKPINSVSDFIEITFEKTLQLETDEGLQSFWFRGEGSNAWKTPLVPKSYRVLSETLSSINDQFNSNTVKVIERNVNAEFYRKALPFISSKKIDNTPWNRYFLMQHYKIPTRLLDWTENALLALFFALSDQSVLEHDARVWILMPFKLNSKTIQNFFIAENNYWIIPHGDNSDKKDEIINSEGKLRIPELTRRYLRMDFVKDEIGNSTGVYYPLAIYPTYLDERMSSQKTCFTVFGNKINGLLSHENMEKGYLDSINIPSSIKGKMLKELQILGIDHSSIYPDLDGLGISIRDKYENKFYDNSETIIHLFESFEKKQSPENF